MSSVKTKSVKDLKEIYLFAGLGPEHLKRLEEVTTLREYKKGQLLFLEGERSERIHILVEGILKVYKSGAKGNEVVMNHFYPTVLIAELANLEHIPYPASAAFETDGAVLTIDYELFEREFLKNPEVSFSIIRSLTRKLMTLDNVISHNLTMSSTAKVAKFIFDNEDLFGKLKQHKVASILNITPETMSRVLRKLRDAGAVDKKGSKFVVTSRDSLEDFFD